MQAEELYKLLHRQPFEPFRLYLSDGRVFDVRYPDMNRVRGTHALIGVLAPGETDPDPFPDYLERIPLALISHVEPLPSATAGADQPGA